MIPEYLEQLVRRNNRKGKAEPVTCNEVPPVMPASAFITADDEVIECVE